MFLLRLIATTLLIMFAFPALGLMSFEGGVLGGLGAALLTFVMSFVVVLASLPLLATVGLGAILAGGAAGGPLGARAVQFGLHTAINTGTLSLTAWVLGGVTLLGFWPTVGAAAILAIVQVILTPTSSND
jgi:hypothetical protein